ncbi:MAG: HAD family phosphatase [Bacteroidales bacterium]|jgi:2-haloacid dehalogenase|nr:HAD family phosphatase [Bacteroidales bacterium]
MKIKNIIFDFGGVLIDWDPRYLYESVFPDKAEMEIFLKNICSPAWNLKQDAGYPLSAATKELQTRYPMYHDAIEMFYKDWIRMVRGEIIENTSLLKPLKIKYRLFGLSNWSAETFPLVYDRYSFFSDFEGIVISGQEKMLKPDKGIYELLLNRYGLKANESLFIDDSINNIITAKEMGLSTIHLDGNASLKEQLLKYRAIRSSS